MENKTLYELMGMKSKNSVFRSVFVTNSRTHDGLQIIEVEPYDQTFLNQTSSVSKYDKTVDRIMKAIYHYFNGKETWLKIYTDNHGGHEILVNEYYMKQYGLL